MMFNVICYIVTGIVCINLLISLFTSIFYMHNDGYEGIKRCMYFHYCELNQCYLLPAISVDRIGKYFEINVYFLKFCLYICYNIKVEDK